MRGQRISLDFRPSKPVSQDLLRNSHRTADKTREDRVSQDSLLSSSPTSIDSLPTKLTTDRKHYDNNPVSQSTLSERELREFEEMEAIVLAQRSIVPDQNKSTELSEDDVLNASVSSDDMNRFRLEVLQRLSADKVKTLEKQSEPVQPKTQDSNEHEHLKNRTGSDQGANVDSDERPEDLLSPINESSEPLNTTGSLPESQSSTPSTTPSSPCSPLEVAPFQPAFFMTSPANTLDKKAYKKAAKQKQKDSLRDMLGNFEAKSSETNQTELLSNFELRRPGKGEKLLNDMTVEKNTAMGTPRFGRSSNTMEQSSIDGARVSSIAESKLSGRGEAVYSPRQKLQERSNFEEEQMDYAMARVSSNMQSKSPNRAEVEETPRQTSVALLARGSYTMDQISIDAARAAGIPVIELRNSADQLRHARTTVRSLSVPLDNDVMLQESLRDKAASSSHSHLPFNSDELTFKSQLVSSGSHPLINESPNAGQFSPQQFDDVVIFDRKRSGTFDSPTPHHEPTLQTLIEDSSDRNNFPDQVDASHSHHNTPRDYYNRTSYTPTSTGEIARSYSNADVPFSYYDNRASYTPTRTGESPRSYSNADVPHSNQHTNAHYGIIAGNNVFNRFYGNAEGVAAEGVRTVYSDQYGTYVKSPRPDSYHGNIQGGASHEPQTVFSDQYGTYAKNSRPESYHGYQHYQGHSSPRAAAEQQATYFKDPRTNIIYKQSFNGHLVENHVFANQIPTSRGYSTVSSAFPGNGSNWNYDQQDYPVSSNHAPTSYSLPGNGTDWRNNQQFPGQTSSQQHSHPDFQHAVPSSPRSIHTAPPFGNRYHEQGIVNDHNRREVVNQEFSPRSKQFDTNFSVTENRISAQNRNDNIAQQFSPRVAHFESSRPENDHRSLTPNRNEVIAQSFSPRATQFENRTQEDDIRIPTPERKSQAFTVDLDTGEFKELNSSTESNSPRSPNSSIQRSNTFKKGPEERVFDYDNPGEQELRPQASEGNPEVVVRKDKHASPACLTNSTSWSESAEALKAVLYNGFPNHKMESDLVPSPRLSSPRKAEKKKPGARITWMTAGRNSFGGQVMLNEKGEIEESKDDDVIPETGHPQHLALLSLHFEEKRRQIEAEKLRSNEKWEQQRRQLDETAFWYTIGRGQSVAKDVGNARLGQEKAGECSSPGLPTPPIGRSTPFECLSPLQTKPSYQSHTVERSQSPGSHGQPAIGHGYHPGTAQRPGNHSSAQTRFQSPVHHGGFDEGQTASQGSYQPSPQTGFQFPAHSQSSGIHQTGFGEGQVASQPGYHATNQISAHSPRVHRTGYQANAQIGSQPPITHQTGFGEDQDAVQAGYQNSAHISADSPVVHQTGFGEGGVVRQPGFDGGRIANQPALQGQEEFETRQFRFSEYAAQEGAQFDEKVPLSPSHNEPTKSPVRKCWEVNPPVENPVFAVPSPEEGQEEDDDMNQYEDPGDDQQQNKKGVALFIGNQAQKPEEGLTPEQQKKKDRFLKNRLKKLEEEKVRKDAENEKKKIREQKQKELEEQKRLEEEQRRDEQQRLQQQRRLKPQGSMGSSGESIHHHDEPSTFNDFSGPRCYVKPTGKSNRKLIINAISHVCLSGTVNKDNKDKCLQAIADTPGFNFIVLFKDGLKFRGLYILNPETEQAFKIFGIGPKVITSKMVDCVYKYSSGGKEFSKIPSKSLSISVDGVAILKSYWQSNKPVVASKTQSNLKRPPRPPQR